MGHGRRASGLNFTTSRPRFNPIGKCSVAGKHYVESHRVAGIGVMEVFFQGMKDFENFC